MKPKELKGTQEPTMHKRPARITKTVPIGKIVASSLFVRSMPGAKEFAEFVQSIERSRGPLHPPLVRPRPGGKYEIICGHMRWQAALRAKETALTVTVVEATDEEALELMATENLHRFATNAVDEAEQLLLLARALDASRPARGGSAPHYLSERKAAELLAPILNKDSETIRAKLGVLPSDPANLERLRAVNASFEHCRRARQLLSRTEIATAEQEKWWVDLVLEAMRKGWSVREMWRAGESQYRISRQGYISPEFAPRPWEPPKHKYDVCGTCGQPWGTHSCPWTPFKNPNAPAPAKLAEMFAAQFPTAAAALVQLVAAKRLTLANGTKLSPPAAKKTTPAKKAAAGFIEEWIGLPPTEATSASSPTPGTPAGGGATLHRTAKAPKKDGATR
jgi:ParB-like chromosome segregation protein Spo0J